MVHLNLENIHDQEELQQYLEEKLQIPERNDKNLDTLYERLTAINGKLHVYMEGLEKLREHMGSYADRLLSVFEQAQEVTQGLTVEVKQKMEKDWERNPALQEQAVSFHRPYLFQLEKNSEQPETQGLMYRADGKPYLRLWFKNAIHVELQVGFHKYIFLEVKKNVWELTLTLQPGFYYATLLLDGSEVLTPFLPIGYGYNQPCNYLDIGPAIEELSVQPILRGDVRYEYFPSKVTQNQECCMVYTPPCYDKTEKEYPVLYLQHGFGENEKSWIFHGKVHHIMDALLEENRAVPMLIVMANGMIAEKALNGEETLCYEKFEPFLLEDLMPFIESKYRVKKERDSRAMAGLSLGSIQTSRIVFKHQELFSYAGLFSGFMKNTLDENADNSHIEILKENPEEFNRNMKLFYRGIGTSDVFLRQFLEEDELCKEYQISQVRKEFQGGHDWNVWRKCICDFLPRLFVSND